MHVVDFLVSLFFTFLGFFAIRDFPLFVFGTFIPCVKANAFILQDLSKKFGSKKIIWFENVTFMMVCLCLIPTFLWVMSNHVFGFGTTDNASNAVNFLLDKDIKGNIYNNFDIGNYLEYRLYPKDEVFVDNRPEAYPKDFFQNIYFPMRESEKKFNQISNKYNFNVIFYDYLELNPDSVQFEQQLVNNKNWKMVYLDNEIVIFLKNTPANQKIINKYLITQDEFKLNKEELNDRYKLLQLANLFKNIKWYKPLLTTTLRYLQFNPTNCSALENVAYLLNQKHDPSYQIYYDKYLQICGNGTM